MNRFNSPMWTVITATVAVLSALLLALASDDGGWGALARDWLTQTPDVMSFEAH